MEKKPIYVDPRLRRIFERQIYRPLIKPELWTGHRFERLFLFYGQKGSGMEEAVLQLLEEHPIPNFTHITVNRDAAEMKMTFEQLKKRTAGGEVIPLLIIRKGHVLKYHRDIFMITHYLKRLENIGFILVLSEEVPDSEHPFWDQFKVRIPNGLPNKDFYKKLLYWHFESWKRSGSPVAGDLLAPRIEQIALDLDELAICCAYTTQSTVKAFVRRVIDYIIDQYPENRPMITMDLLKELNFLYPFAGNTSVLSISPFDGHTIQSRFDPMGITEAVDIDAEPEKKKFKFSMEGEAQPSPIAVAEETKA